MFALITQKVQGLFPAISPGDKGYMGWYVRVYFGCTKSGWRLALSFVRKSAMTEFHALSSREQEVMELLLQGKSNKQIASALGVAESTVEFHLRNIYGKYQVSSRVELILKLRESIVAERGKAAENRDRFNLKDWAAALREAVSKIGKEFAMNSINTNARSGGNTMTFFDSIRVCLTKYADFEG